MVSQLPADRRGHPRPGALRGRADPRFVVDADGKKMSKSLGNVIAPKEVIEQYGAEILRLWVSASDYREDIRISDNILKQLSEAYRRIRNTCRFMLGNLFDFDPPTDRVAYDSMLEIDRYALHRLQGLIRRTRSGLRCYEFHTIYHALHNYCALDLSAFYLDILKDRLYTSPPASIRRRSAQTALYAILDAMVRLMAPVLSFTAEEIWGFMPPVPGKQPACTKPACPKSTRPCWTSRPGRELGPDTRRPGRGDQGPGNGAHPENHRPSPGCGRDPWPRSTLYDSWHPMPTNCGRFSSCRRQGW